MSGKTPREASDKKRGDERLKVVGTLVRGLGESAKFLSIPWVKAQLVEKLGFSPYGGTLNIDVHDPAIQERLKGCRGEKILPEEEGFCDAFLWSGVIGGKYPCAVVLPLVPGYPECILEIVAPLYLKQALAIEDGDGVEVEVYLKFGSAVRPGAHERNPDLSWPGALGKRGRAGKEAKQGRGKA